LKPAEFLSLIPDLCLKLTSRVFGQSELFAQTFALHLQTRCRSRYARLSTEPVGCPRQSSTRSRQTAANLGKTLQFVLSFGLPPLGFVRGHASLTLAADAPWTVLGLFEDLGEWVTAERTIKPGLLVVEMMCVG